MNKLHHPVRFILRLAALAAVTGASQAQAVVLFSTDFSGASQAVANGPIAMGGTAASGITVGTLAKRGGATFTIFDYNTTAGGGWDVAPVFAGARPSQLPNALNDAQSVEFSLTNATGETISIAAFSFNLVRKGFGGDAGSSVWSSADDYATPLRSFSNDALSGTKSLVSVGSLALELAPAATITFRIALWTPSTSAGDARLGIDDLVITAVPEPALTGLLLGLLGLGVVLYRRRAA
jgi:hypothetical protein